MQKKSIFLLLLFLGIRVFSQETLDSVQKIDEVLIQTKRLEVPLSKLSHTTTVLTAKEIHSLGEVSMDQVLQKIIGVDVRRRGVEGMQSDLYIRGGNFNQTLLLIDGIKMDDMQSGHHTMNGIIDIDNIERIEITRGAASRIYGQNAMNGVVNIITKKVTKDQTTLGLKYGSFDNYAIRLGTQQLFQKGAVQFQLSRQESSGYRYNTDFTNWNTFFKTSLKNYELLFSYGQRAFGANGFYASPDYKDQYEETQTHLLAIKHHWNDTNKKINTSVYWRRNNDLYLFLRDNPDFYKNRHTNHKIGAGIDASFDSKWGQTGVGLDVNQGYLVSTNLQNHKRFTANLFLEHRIALSHNKLQITPGLAWVYYSDFHSFIYPGIDVGYFFSDKWKLYTSLGYTSRIPTYTNLYYTSPAEIGNPDLKPEKALTYDVGLSYYNTAIQVDITYFNRQSQDLIDWVKNDAASKWMAVNSNASLAQGVEFQLNYSYSIRHFSQKIGLGLMQIDDSIEGNSFSFSRYTLNSYKQRVSLQLHNQFFSSLQQNIAYSFAKRLDGQQYHLLDFSLAYKLPKWQFNLGFNNILNATYTETNLVPMPKANYMLSVQYEF